MSTERPLDAEQLGAFQVLAGVSLAAREELLQSSKELRLGKGDVLIRQGEANQHMYLLLEGSLGVYLKALEGEPVARLPAGETVGELSVLDERAASASVVALEPSRVLAVDVPTFWSLTHESHAFTLNLLLKVAGRLRANNDTVSENVEQRRRFERAALFDGLTGVRNRRWLDDTLHRLTRRYAKSESPLSLAMLDIDHFKQFNDRFGHAAGDYVLTVVAKLLSANLRPTDLVARFGGEEFVLILPDIELESAGRACERVRDSVASEQLRLADGTALPHVTVSIGVCQLKRGQSVPEFLLTADQAMYRVKQQGRNKVEIGS